MMFSGPNQVQKSTLIKLISCAKCCMKWTQICLCTPTITSWANKMICETLFTNQMHTKQSELYTRAQVMYSYILYPDIQICILPTSISEGSLLAIYNIVDLLSCGKLASSVSLLFLLYFALEEEEYWSHWSHHRTGHSSEFKRYPPEIIIILVCTGF